MSDVKNVNYETKKGMQQLPIGHFELSMFTRAPSIVMIAKRRSGKSWVCRSIMYYFRTIPVGIVICKTERMDPFYKEFIPDTFIYYDYQSEIIEKLLDRQTMIKEKSDERKAKGKRELDTRAFIIMDDCLSQKGAWMRDKRVYELLFEGRHYDIMYILTMQFPLGITPELRNNFDYIFLLAEDFQSNLKRIYDHYAGMFHTFESFKQVFNQLTQNYGCMVIANGGARKTFWDKVFWYKAINPPQFMVGCKQFKRYHDLNYDKDWKKKSKIFDFGEYCNKKKKDGKSIQVHKMN